MTLLITVAYLAVLGGAVAILVRWGRVRCAGPAPVGTFTLVALLFTAGLDVGLVMLPLTEFPIYAREEIYGFTNPLAVAFAMWGPLVWAMYFVTAFYFVVLEPRLRVFEIPAVKWIYNLTIIATCAFTCYLFLTALPTYAPGLPAWGAWALAMLVVAVAVYSSGDFAFMKWLAILSTWVFGILAFTCLVIVAYVQTGIGLAGLLASLAELRGYALNLHRFVTPLSDHHEFYLFWWFSWSLMIGQFVARYVGGLPAWRLAVAMVILPTIPIALWFAVLYLYFQHAIAVPGWLNALMVFVGVVFVVNSLDSLIRLYAANLGWSLDALGPRRYYPLHFALQLGLVLAYFYTPFRIEWVGVVVIGLYLITAGTILKSINREIE